MMAVSENWVFPKKYNWLVVWNMFFLTFPYIGNVIVPTDELIFFRGVGQPPTSREYDVKPVNLGVPYFSKLDDPKDGSLDTPNLFSNGAIS